MSSVAYGLAGLCGLGGLMGFVRKGSVMSAVAGGAIAAAYAYSGSLYANKDSAQGRYIAMGASGVLGGAMAVRYLKTLKPLPLVLTVVGVGAFVYFAVSN